MIAVEKLLAWLRPAPQYRMAPPVAHPERLHHSTIRNTEPARRIDWEAMRQRVIDQRRAA